MDKILYICDGKKPCSRYESCHVDCFHTQDELHAKNGILHDVMELKSRRFKKVVVHDELNIYLER